MIRSTRIGGPDLDVLLTNAFYAYRQGLMRQGETRSAMPTRDFDALKFLGTVGWAPPLDRLRLRNLHVACSEGLGASRRGDIDAAVAYYQRGKEALDLLENSNRLAWVLGVSTYEAGIAYLDFRQGLSERACQRLDHAMDADLELEGSGLTVMLMHRIQQGHNLARMHLRGGRRETAIELCGLLIAYMEGQIGHLPFHHHWQLRPLQAVPRKLLRAMIDQVLGELAGFIVTGDAAAKEWGGLVEASRPCQNPDVAVFPQAQFALWAQFNRLAQDPQGYLRYLERFFSYGIRDCHLLWYSLMTGLVEFCLEMDTHRSQEVRLAILRDSVKWKGLPAFLRARLPSLPSAQRVVA